MVEQGDIINVRGIDNHLLVISRDTYNRSGHVIVLPILSSADKNALVMSIDTTMVKGVVACDNPRRLDIKSRDYFHKGRVSIKELILILDLFNSLFDII